MAAPGDRIEVRGLRLVATHGLLEEEARPQPFEVDLDLAVDTGPAAASDDLADAVDYGAVLDAVAAVLGGPRRRLLESLAAAVAERVLTTWPAVTEATVTVRKLRPPVPHDVASVGVRVTRRR